MALNETKNDAAGNKRVGADSPKKADTSRDPLEHSGELKLAAVTLGCAVALYALRSIPLPSR